MERIRDDYFIQGVRLADLAEAYGTPLYLYDADTIRLRFHSLKHAFQHSDVKIMYAMKANSSLAILAYLRELGAGLDTVSIPEIAMGLKAGFSTSDMVFTPNMVHFREIEEAVKKGVRVNIENLSNLAKFGVAYGRSVPCCLRLNPYLVEGSHQALVKEWYGKSKFGLSIRLFDQVEETVQKYDIVVNGLHMHASHVIMSRELLSEAAEMIFGIAQRFPSLEYIDFGGGLNASSAGGQMPMEVRALGGYLDARFVEFCRKYGRSLQLWFEPGRFLVGESGILLASAEIVKSNGEITFAGLNTGFNHLIRPRLYNAFHEIVNISNPSGPLKKYNVVGNLCEADSFAEDRMIPDIREGDLLAILNAGAYGYSMSSQYNARLRPAEVMIRDGKDWLIRKRETLDDLLSNQVIPWTDPS